MDLYFFKRKRRSGISGPPDAIITLAEGCVDERDVAIAAIRWTCPTPRQDCT